ncbi:hypothetical protein SAMN05216299_10621 [Nitrosospira sp. Nsp14]|nr:hypothetical protein SAMN05216299_10621 [Nitrosospira sp. Nsp14]
MNAGAPHECIRQDSIAETGAGDARIRRSIGPSRAVQESHGIVAYLFLPPLQPRKPVPHVPLSLDLRHRIVFRMPEGYVLYIYPVKFKVFSFSGQTFDYYR